MGKKLLVWLLVASLLAGCLSQSQPTPTPSPTSVNNPPIVDFSYSWTGGDETQPWTCSKITFKAEVSDPDRDSLSLYWYDNGNRVPNALGEPEFSAKLWPDGMHTIKFMVLDSRGAQTIVEKKIDVKYEVPEPVPVKTKDEVNIAINYTPMGAGDEATHPEQSWTYSIFTPVLGRYDLTNPVTVDWHIKWALEHGINNFWIMIAPHGNPPEIVDKGSMMTYYRDGFLKAKYKEKIKVTAMLDTRNYNPYNSNFISTDSIEKDIEMLSKYYFSNSNYSKQDGKPVLFLSSSTLYLCPTCEDKAKREKLLEAHIKIIRETAKKNGYELFLIGDNQNAFHECDIDEFLIKSFDAITSYGMEGARNPDNYDWKIDEKERKILIAPYDNLVDNAIKREIELSGLAKGATKTYIPFAEAGFDAEKRFLAGIRDWMIKRTNPTPKKFEEFVNGIKSLIDPRLNILLTTYNELLEGNAIEPTKEFGFAYLDIIRDNFAIKPASGWPPDIVSTKNCGCAEYKG